MTGPESCTAHQISRSELLICVYESVLRPDKQVSDAQDPVLKLVMIIQITNSCIRELIYGTTAF
eukprot:COSAG02_NODE_1739_length_11117_cov_14.095843_1_plen_64_part_00